MAGLGLGSQAGRRWSARLDPRRRCCTFAAGGAGDRALRRGERLALLRPALRARGRLYARPWRAGVLHFLALLLPTVLMGISLPLLVRATVRDVRRRGAHDRDPLRHEPARGGAGRAAHAVGADPLRRASGARSARRRRPTSWSAVAGLAVARFAPRREGPAPTAPAACGGKRAGTGPARCGGALYALAGSRALAGDALVPHGGGGGEGQGVHLRHRARPLPGRASPWAAWPPRLLVQRVGRPLRAFLLCQCALLVYAGGRRGPARPAARGHARLRVARRVLGAKPRTDPGRRREPAASRASTSRCPWCCSGRPPSSWGSPSRCCSARCRTIRARAAARSGSCRRPTSRAAWRAASLVGLWAVALAGHHGHRCGSVVLLGLGFCRGRRGSTAGARALRRAGAALLVAAAAAVPPERALWPACTARRAPRRSWTRTPPAWPRSCPSRRAPGRCREREAPQLAPVRRRAHAPRRGARRHASGARGRRDHRPGLGRHGVGGRLPEGDAVA